MRVSVWIDAGQQQCCGEPFRTGEVVSWEVNEKPGYEGLAVRMNAEYAGGVRYVQEHHGDDPDGAVTGRISHIDVVACLRENGTLLVGSGRPLPVAADTDVPEGLQGDELWTLEGWVVRLDLLTS
ncbi:DUF6578 domain-containing protein [Kineosporia babensis]|uniref:Uncharacterized protein n=1 Tax=Kineosporia babensis TaxID=499548 RepID=A0A9X1NAE4_9ACTN|nr:DUF6578 domain-containing protein [Kineosporia babensis]MCD5311332.1 hypothetical protein [Kineosporia babensis]